MRHKAKKILYETLKSEGNEELLFPTGKISDNNALIETIIDAMIKLKNNK